MRKLKVLVLTLIAIGAVSAVAAATASAEYHIASVTGGSITGTQQTQEVFTTDVGAVKSSGVTLTGSQATETASTLTLHPTYSGSTLAGLKVTVNTGTCNYEFLKPTTEQPANDTTHANMNIQCASGTIVIKDTAGLGCEIQIDSQGPLNRVKFENITASGKVLLTTEISGVSYSWTGSCPNAGGVPGSSTNGTYTGSVLLSGSALLSVT